MPKTGLVIVLLSIARLAQAQQGGLQAQQAQQAQQGAQALQLSDQAAAAQRAQQQAQQPLRLSLDPTRVVTVGLWSGPDVPCKLPKRDRPYVCHRLLVGPAVVLSQMGGELIAARGDAALAKGERSWWIREMLAPMPLGLAPGEVLYQVGDYNGGESDRVATVYR